MKNIIINADELNAIRLMDDFDLKMLLSEINDLGWENARTLIKAILDSSKAEICN